MRLKYPILVILLYLSSVNLGSWPPANVVPQEPGLGAKSANDLSRADIVIKGGYVYFTAGTHIVALESRTGKALWTAPLAGEIASGLTMVGSYLYVAVYDPKAKSGLIIYAIDSASGQVRWSRDHRSFVIWGGDNAIYLQVQGGNDLQAVDPATGQDVWFAQGTQFGSVDSLAVHDGRIYTGTRVLDAKTGKQLWEWPEDINISTLVAVAHKVYVGGHSLLAVMDARSGEVLWRTKSLTGKDIAGLAATDTHVYAAAYNGRPLVTHDGVLVVFDAARGASLWSYSLYSSCQTLGPDPISVFDEKVYVVVPADEKTGTELVALDAATGERLWSYRSAKWLRGPAIASGPYVYVRAPLYELIALDQRTGEEVWVYSLPEKGE